MYTDSWSYQITDIDVSSMLATWSSTIILQFYSDLVIMIDNIVVDIIYLIFQEVLGPDHLGQ